MMHEFFIFGEFIAKSVENGGERQIMDIGFHLNIINIGVDHLRMFVVVYEEDLGSCGECGASNEIAMGFVVRCSKRFDDGSV